MNITTTKLDQLLKCGYEYLSQASEQELNTNPSPNKWSKKEILGHLIDSGIHNLQRFTEIQYESKPYIIRSYKQNELVYANKYQNADSKELIRFWWSLNKRILFIIQMQTEKTLYYQIELEKGNLSDLGFLIKDYVNHLEHHLNQIIK
jgi:hypothetical protein